MTLVLFSDLHLDAAFAWLGLEGAAARRRRQALRDTLERIIRLAQEVRADALLCGGDLYEQERFSPDTAAFLQAAFAAAAPLPIFLAPGNHDWYGSRSLYQQTVWSANVHIFTGDRLAPATLADGLTLWGAAHLAPANTPGFLDGFTLDRGGMHLALFHGAERGDFAGQESGKQPHAPFSAGQIAAAGLHHAFLGHYHRPREAADYTYPGNPEPLTFGEDGVRGAVIATIAENGTVGREWRRVAATAAHDLSVDLSGCASRQEARERVRLAVAGLTGAARVTLGGNLAPEVDLRSDDFAGLAPWLDGLLVRAGELRPAYDLQAIAEEPTVRGQFVRDVLAAALPEEERRRVLITGLRALDGRSDLEAL